MYKRTPKAKAPAKKPAAKKPAAKVSKGKMPMGPDGRPAFLKGKGKAAATPAAKGSGKTSKLPPALAKKANQMKAKARTKK